VNRFEDQDGFKLEYELHEVLLKGVTKPSDPAGACSQEKSNVKTPRVALLFSHFARDNSSQKDSCFPLISRALSLSIAYTKTYTKKERDLRREGQTCLDSRKVYKVVEHTRDASRAKFFRAIQHDSRCNHRDVTIVSQYRPDRTRDRIGLAVKNR